MNDFLICRIYTQQHGEKEMPFAASGGTAVLDDRPVTVHPLSDIVTQFETLVRSKRTHLAFVVTPGDETRGGNITSGEDITQVLRGMLTRKEAGGPLEELHLFHMPNGG